MAVSILDLLSSLIKVYYGVYVPESQQLLFEWISDEKCLLSTTLLFHDGWTFTQANNFGVTTLTFTFDANGVCLHGTACSRIDIITHVQVGGIKT